MPSSFDRVVVTGGCGFLGQHLVQSLKKVSKSITIIDYAISPEANEELEDINIHAVDICEHTGWEKIFAGADVVFHLAGNSNGTLSILRPHYDYKLNFIGTKNVAGAAMRSDARLLIYVSSASVYGRPQGFPLSEDHQTKPFIHYGISKLLGETYCLELNRERGFPVVIARPFCVYGDRENTSVSLCEVGRYLRWHYNGHPIQIVGDKVRKTRDFVSVQDCISGLLHIAEKGTVGEIYNIGSGQETSMLELVHLIERITGTAARIREIAHITDDTYRLVADISKLRCLGYDPKVTLEQGIRQMLSNSAEMQQVPTTMTIFSPDQVAETFDSPGRDADTPARVA